MALWCEQTYETVCAYVHPKTPVAVAFGEFTAALTAHFDPRPSEVYNHMLFQRRDQLPGESVTAYTVAHRKEHADCNFVITDTVTRLYTVCTMLSLDVMLWGRLSVASGTPISSSAYSQSKTCPSRWHPTSPSVRRAW